jgi:hypothetical protein
MRPWDPQESSLAHVVTRGLIILVLPEAEVPSLTPVLLEAVSINKVDAYSSDEDVGCDKN